MVNFYRRFVLGAAGLLKLLTDALKGGKHVKLVWSEEMETAYTDSKQKLANVAKLAHPHATGQLVLSVDASYTHVGAVLQQWEARLAL